MKSKFKRIDTVFVPVSDVQKAEKWYMNVFPFRVVYRSDDGEWVGFRFDDDEPIKTGLSLYKNVGPKPKQITFNFYVEDVDQVHRSLKEQGIEVHEIHEAGGMRFFDFCDPFGNNLNVVTF